MVQIVEVKNKKVIITTGIIKFIKSKMLYHRWQQSINCWLLC